MDTKTFRGVEVKDAERGEVTAVFSTFNKIDSDGDVTLPGAFEDGTAVKISAYGHASWAGALPVGKGTIRTTKDEAILDGRFFLNTTAGRDTFEVIKELGELQEWSYSVEPAKHSFGEFEGRKVQFLEKLNGPTEVSPVLRGAGIDTRSLAVKSDLKFADEAQAVMAALSALSDRAADVMAKRLEKGKGLGADSAALLEQVEAELKRLSGLLAGPGPQPYQQADVERELMRFIAANFARE